MSKEGFAEIIAARRRISPYIIETPMLRLKTLDAYFNCQVYVKAECMQTTGAFKLRGAMNKALSLSGEELERGLVCASSGNHGRAIAYAAKLLGAKATVVMPYGAPEVKVNAVKSLGAEVVQCETSQRFLVAEQICARQQATPVPPFDDEYVMAGQGTAGLELVEKCPELDCVIAPVSGGGLIGGVSTAVKGVSPNIRVYGAEPAALPRYSLSLAAKKIVTVPQRKTLADALLCQAPGVKCFPVVQENVDAVFPVDDEYTLRAMKLLLTEGKLLAEASGCIGMGAVLQGKLGLRPEEKVCFVVSGGNVGISQLSMLNEL